MSDEHDGEKTEAEETDDKPACISAIFLVNQVEALYRIDAFGDISREDFEDEIESMKDQLLCRNFAILPAHYQIEPA